ncbi:YgaP family membrane protein [Pedobacter paludis]|uniref:DUF2892 domain-containing protein n=1 Tax=Pedobacter paludis TaxID=2203212 RepID=A0A317EZ20_9SPHI|nr:DUF2892 domain-containing protein [Pedobacter paludis]PWS30446.1 DUF2892 domain-containing protein [Pedobacter paludis]
MEKCLVKIRTMEMKTNMGLLDRALRTLLAIAILPAYILGIFNASAELALISIAGILLWTGIFGFCPLYMALDIRTNRHR